MIINRMTIDGNAGMHQPPTRREESMNGLVESCDRLACGANNIDACWKWSSAMKRWGMWTDRPHYGLRWIGWMMIWLFCITAAWWHKPPVFLKFNLNYVTSISSDALITWLIYKSTHSSSKNLPERWLCTFDDEIVVWLVHSVIGCLHSIIRN